MSEFAEKFQKAVVTLDYDSVEALLKEWYPVGLVVDIMGRRWMVLYHENVWSPHPAVTLINSDLDEKLIPVDTLQKLCA